MSCSQVAIDHFTFMKVGVAMYKAKEMAVCSLYSSLKFFFTINFVELKFQDKTAMPNLNVQHEMVYKQNYLHFNNFTFR